MSADFLRRLIDYNTWANRTVLRRAHDLPDDEYHSHVAGLSYGTIHAALVHILVAEIVWLARWRGEIPPLGLRDARDAERIAVADLPSLTALQERWDRETIEQARFFATLTAEGARATIRYQRQMGDEQSWDLGALVAHIVNHGTQFRAEAAVGLTQFGHGPGDLDLIEFLRLHANGAAGTG